MKQIFSYFIALSLLAYTMSAQAVTFKFEGGTLQNDTLRPTTAHPATVLCF